MDTKHNILVIDDEPFNLDILQEHLEDVGYCVVTAEDGKQGLEIINSGQYKFDLILLDRMMPVLNGMEFLKEIKSHGEMGTIPVIMQTAAASDKDIIEGINAGAYYYLTKPFEPEVMVSIVKAAINDFVSRKDSEISIISYEKVCPFIQSMEFNIQSLDEANILAGVLACICPVPEKVIMGISELLINAIEHGNLGITYNEKSLLLKENRWRDEVINRLSLEKNKHKFVHVDIKRHKKHLLLTITDQGPGFNFKDYLKVEPSRVFDPHGRGIAIAAMMSFDKVEFISCGNKVCCTINYN